MTHSDVYKRVPRVGAAALLSALAAVGCDTTLPPMAPRGVDANSSCALLHAPATTAQDALGAACDAEDAGVKGFADTHALGFGYPFDTTELPDHQAFLTFDDGPSEWTNDFLDVLKERGVRATFFVTAEQLKGPVGLRGSYVDEHGATQVFERLLKREVDEGHGLGNHTVNHPDLGQMRDEQVESEFDQNELQVSQALLRAGGLPAILSLLRPPYGSPWFTGPTETDAPLGAQKQVAERIGRHGLNILWNIDSTDSREWALNESYSRTKHETPGADAPTFDTKTGRILDTVLSDPLVERGAGIVVLMHDTHPTTLAALPAMIDGLKKAGYSFATVEDYVLRRWQRPSIQLTPGPSRHLGCVAARDWGCMKSGGVEVCGRMWSAYEALGGEARLGSALRAQERDSDTGIVSQAFERAVVELHPENAPPCNVIAQGL